LTTAGGRSKGGDIFIKQSFGVFFSAVRSRTTSSSSSVAEVSEERIGRFSIKPSMATTKTPVGSHGPHVIGQQNPLSLLANCPISPVSMFVFHDIPILICGY
jgi:hypothetical protein